METSLFRNKKANPQKLSNFGFSVQDSRYIYETLIAKGQFCLIVTIKNDQVQTQVIDTVSCEEYTLYKQADATGTFIGMVRTEVEAVLANIAERCFDTDVFKTVQAKQIISYVRDKYNDELEFLWSKFPDNAIWRRKDTSKWYGAILTVSARKLGLNSDEKIEIIDLRIKPEALSSTVDNQRYFPGYHMNKKHWYTIILDGSVNVEEISNRIDESYLLARK